jgi:hypothetical protein
MPLAVILAGCSFSPLQKRIAVGEEPFVVFVGEGADGRTDIFAGLPAGGELSRITFTPIEESHPTLTPEGDMVAFIRYPSETALSTPRLVVMNLLNGAERELETLATAGGIEAMAWAPDRDGLLVRDSESTWWVPFPDGESRRVDGAERASADSLLDVLLGEPRFARAAPCPGGAGVCVTGPSGEPARLSSTGRDPFRWGSDSVAWFEDDRLLVRPLGPGAVRTIAWTGMPTGLRQGSYAWRVVRSQESGVGSR